MKQIIYILAITIYCFSNSTIAFGQGMAINGTGSAAHPSAMLDVASTTQGMLVPRMTEAEKQAIASPATGLMIFQTDGTMGFYYYNGTAWSAVGGSGGAVGSLPAGATGDLLYYNGSAWVSLPAGANGKVLVVNGGVPTWMPTTSLTVGSSYGGGIVAYLLQPGDIGYEPSVQHGLIAATADQSILRAWSNGSLITTYTLSTGIGMGLSNTMGIIALQGLGSYAASEARSYTVSGYNDWYLPSRDELNKLYLNKDVIGGFSAVEYWSSSELASVAAYRQNFGTGTQSGGFKSNTYNVRVVRSF